MWRCTVWLCVATLCSVASDTITKSLTETEDAVILDADLPDKNTKAATTSTRLFTGNAAIDGAVVGLGVGVLGSLLVGKLLDEKKKCNPRGRREADTNTASTRFLPGLLGGNNKCPPGYNQQYPTGYQPNTGYQQPNQGYQPSSGRLPTNGNQYNSGYQQPNSGYQRPNSGYQQPNIGYQQPNIGYQQPNIGYQQPNIGYQRPNSGYQRPNSGYQQPNSGYQQPNSGYQRPNSGYQRPTSGYQQPYRNAQSSFSQTSSHKATPAPFSSGLSSHQPQQEHPIRNTPAQSTQNYHPGILGRSLKASDKTKVNFGN